MKVYFQAGGISFCKGKESVTIKVYVNPDREDETTHAYKYNSLGHTYRFAWADPYKALCVDSDSLPKVMWESIRHGANDFHIDDDAEDVWIGRKSVTLDKLKYTPVNLEKIEVYKKVCEEIDKVSTIDEFKELYPMIKKGDRINESIVYKLLSLMNITPVHYKNGEIGMEFLHNAFIYEQCLEELNLK